MVRGIYTGASGMVANQHRLDAISNNMANVDVTGYKRDQAAFKAFPELMLRRTNDNGMRTIPWGVVDKAPVVGKLGTGVELNEIYTVFEQGSLKETGNSFDIALEGDGFFAVMTPEGERYTRNGSFLIGPEGMLVTKQGYPVLGENGPINVKKHNIMIDQDGKIFHNKLLADDPNRLVGETENQWEESELLDTLKLVSFKRTRFLQKKGESLWMDTEFSGKAQVMGKELDAPRPKVYSGFLEGSNVNPVTEMVQMIEVNRAYEANQKVIQSEDQSLGKLINEYARF